MQVNELLLAMWQTQATQRQMFEPLDAPGRRRAVSARGRRGESRWRRPQQ